MPCVALMSALGASGLIVLNLNSSESDPHQTPPFNLPLVDVRGVAERFRLLGDPERPIAVARRSPMKMSVTEFVPLGVAPWMIGRGASGCKSRMSAVGYLGPAAMSAPCPL